MITGDGSLAIDGNNTADVSVLKVISGAGEVGQIYTFKGNKLRHIGIVSRYKYY